MLNALFSAAVVTHETHYPAALSPLLEEEALHTGGMSERRLLEFRAGRHCAREALRRLGLGSLPVARGPDRAPVWPPSVTGSITHVFERDAGWAAAAVARTSEVRALGLDAERDVPLDDDLLAIVLTRRELGRLAQASDEERALLGKLAFSAKEAFYKCQYTLTRQFLDFSDVEVDFDLSTSRFSARLLRDAGAFVAGSALDGRFTRQQGWIVSGVELGV